MKSNQIIVIAAILVTTSLAGCADTNRQASSPSYSSSNNNYSDSYGTVDSIRVVRVEGSESGVGAVVGGVIGGLLGNQVGGGTGRSAATVVGAVGGAVAGNQIEKNRQGQGRDVYQIGVRVQNGSYHTVTQDSISDLRVGDRVRIENDRVYRN